VVARQNRPASGPLFAAMEPDALLVPPEVVARQVYAQPSTPLLWRFLRERPAQGDEWAADLVERLTDVCGQYLQALWKVRLNHREAPGSTAGRPRARSGWVTAAQPGGPRRAPARGGPAGAAP
jgi:voltage-gated potassium channel